MDQDLSFKDRLRAAQLADQRVMEQQQLERVAETLPALEREAQRQKQLTAAKAERDAAFEKARGRLVELKIECTKKRERLEFAIAEIQNLCKELPAASSLVVKIGHELYEACAQVAYLESLSNAHRGSPNAGESGEAEPDAPAAPLTIVFEERFRELWNQAGGFAPALRLALDQRKVPETLYRYFRENRCEVLYDPANKIWIRFIIGG